MDYKVTDTELTSIANAIRMKGGTSEQLAFPAGFVSAVDDISGDNTYAFIRASSAIKAASNGVKSITPTVSEEMSIFSIPEPSSLPETWELLDDADNIVDRVIIKAYGTSVTTEGISLVPVLSSLQGSNGHVIYNTGVNFYWNGTGDVWKAFDGNETSYGQYIGEDQSNFWLGYLFDSPVVVTKTEFYGGNYSGSDNFEVIVEYTQDGATWENAGVFYQAHNDSSLKRIEINSRALGVRWRSPTQKTSGHNLFIKELKIYGY